MPGAASAMTALKAAAQQAELLKAQSAKLATTKAPVASVSDGQDVYKEPAFVKDSNASIAASEAAFEKWEANEQKFEAENGFRRQAHSGVIGMYAHAQTGRFGTALINTRKDMNDHLDRFISGFVRDVELINQSGGGSLKVGDAYAGPVPKGLDDKATAVFLAKSQDNLEARRMTLFAETAYVAKSLGLSQPVVTQKDGRVSFNEQDIALNGKPFARISADGSLTLLAPNPDPARPDPADLYTPSVDRRI
jgi:hypothetical protein